MKKNIKRVLAFLCVLCMFVTGEGGALLSFAVNAANAGKEVLTADEVSYAPPAVRAIYAPQGKLVQQGLLNTSGAVAKSRVITTADGSKFRVRVSYDKSAGVPDDADLFLSELTAANEPNYGEYIEKSRNLLGLDESAPIAANAFDITLRSTKTGQEYQPDKEVDIEFTLLNEDGSDTRLSVVHFPDEAKPTDTVETPAETPVETPAETPVEAPTETPVETPAETPAETPTEPTDDKQEETATAEQEAKPAEVGEPELLEGESKDGKTVVSTDGFSVYVVLRTVKKTQTLTADDGKTYEIAVTYDVSSGIPYDAELIVDELTEGSKYDYYVSKTISALGRRAEQVPVARVFDIVLVDPENGDVYDNEESFKVSVRLLSDDVKKDSKLNVTQFEEQTIEVPIEVIVNKKKAEVEDKTEDGTKTETAEAEKSDEAKASSEAEQGETNKTPKTSISEKLSKIKSDKLESADVKSANSIKAQLAEQDKAKTEPNEDEDKFIEKKIIYKQIKVDMPFPMESTTNKDAVEFDAPTSGIYVVTETTKETTLTASNGETYKVSVTYGDDAKIPLNAELKVEEITEDNEDYDRYVDSTVKETGFAKEGIVFTGVFDISFVDPETGETYQPNESVKVNIELYDEDVTDVEKIGVVHFDGESHDDAEVMPSKIKDEAIEFETKGFSVYAVAGYTAVTYYRDFEGNTWEISAEYTSDTGLPADVELKVRELSEQERDQYLSDAASALDKNEKQIKIAKAFDITFEKDGVAYHALNDDVKITIRFMDDTAEEETNVVHIGDTSERMETTAEGDTLTFSSDSFSVYIVTHKELTRTYTFMNGNAVYSRQVLLNGETLEEPLAPVRNGTVFRYWSTEEGGDEFTGFGTVTVTESDHADVTLYAVYEADNVYITFYDQEGAIVQREAIRRPTGSETVTFDTTQVDYIPMQTRSDVYLKFRFWVQGLAELGEPTPRQVGNKGVITLNAETKDIDLYPIVAEGHWMMFDSNKAGVDGSSVTYAAPLFVVNGERLGTGENEISIIMDRNVTSNGYVFDGWYTRKNGGNRVFKPVWVDENGNVVSADTAGAIQAVAVDTDEKGLSSLVDEYGDLGSDPTVYAHWHKVETTTYSVAYYIQKASDSPNQNPKNYDFLKDAGSYTCTTGVTRSLNDFIAAKGGNSFDIFRDAFRDERLDDASVDADTKRFLQAQYENDRAGFELSTVNNVAVEVKPDGSTLLKIYFDRKQFSLKFDYSISATTFTINGKKYVLSNNTSTSTENGQNVVTAYSNLNSTLYCWEYVSTFRYNRRDYYVVPQNGERLSVIKYNTSNGTIYCSRFLTIQELYGHTISDRFPLVKESTGTEWRDISGEHYITICSIGTMPSFDVTFYGSAKGSKKIIWYFFETVDGETRTNETVSIAADNGTTYTCSKYEQYPNETSTWYKQDDYMLNDFARLLEKEDFYSIQGFTQYKSDPKFTNGEITAGFNNTKFYYKRHRLTLTIKNTLTSETKYWTGDAAADKHNSGNRIKFGQPINDLDAYKFVIENSRPFRKDEETKERIWWFYDKECTMPVTFPFTMPDHDVTIYEGLEYSYLVKIEPNGGEMFGEDGVKNNYSSWFYMKKDELVGEYGNIARDYVKARPGETATHWYDEHPYTAEESEDRTYVYRDTNVEGKDKLYVYRPGRYMLTGWYEVVNGKVRSTPYNFNKKLDAPLTLRAGWRRTSNYTVVYDAGDGVRAPIDINEYIEGAHAMVMASIDSGAGQRFVGWKDANGKVYKPNSLLEITEDVAVEQDDGSMVITLTAYYGDSKLYDYYMADYDFMVGDTKYYTETIAKGETLVQPKAPTSPDPNKVFVGWYLDTEGKHRFEGFGVINYPVYTTLYARFEQTYVVTYYMADAHGNKGDAIIGTQTYLPNEYLNTLYVTYPTDGDHVVEYWVDAEGNRYLYKAVSNTVQVTKDMDLWPKLAEQKVLRFDLQGGTTAEGSKYMDPVTIPTQGWPSMPKEPIRKGYLFEGWYTEPKGKGTEYLFNMTLARFKSENNLSEDVNTLYAYWVMDTEHPVPSELNILWYAQLPDGGSEDESYELANSKTVTFNLGEYSMNDEATVNALTAAVGSDIKNVAQLEFLYKEPMGRYDSAKMADYFVWSDAKNSQTEFEVDDTGNSTLKLYFNRKQYRLRFDLVNGILYNRSSESSQSYSSYNNRIEYGGARYTGSDYTTIVWLEKDVTNEWPRWCENKTMGAETANVIWNPSSSRNPDGAKFYGWKIKSGNYNYFTTQYTAGTTLIDRIKETGKVVNGLTEVTLSVYGRTNTETYILQYWFDGIHNRDYDQIMEAGSSVIEKSGKKFFTSFTAKDFDGYEVITDSTQEDYCYRDGTRNYGMVKTAQDSSGYEDYTLYHYYVADEWQNVQFYDRVERQFVLLPFPHYENVLRDPIVITPNAKGNVETRNGVTYTDVPNNYRINIGSASGREKTGGSVWYYDRARNVYVEVSWTKLITEIIRYNTITAQRQVTNSHQTINYYYKRKVYSVVLMDYEGVNILGTFQEPYQQQMSGSNGQLETEAYRSKIPNAGEPYVFVCWSKAPNAPNTPFEGTMPAHTLTLYACKKLREVRVLTRGVKADGTLTTEPDEFYRSVNTYNTELRDFDIPQPTKEGENFVGWFVVKDGVETDTPISLNDLIRDDVEIWAKFETLKEAQVKYDRNGGNEASGALPVDDNKYIIGAKIDVKSGEGMTKTMTDIAGETYEGEFVCWNTKPDGTGISYYRDDRLSIGETDGVLVDNIRTLTLYAQYSRKRETKLIYDGNGGRLAPMNNSDVEAFNALLKDAQYTITFLDDFEKNKEDYKGHPNTLITIGYTDGDQAGIPFTAVRSGYSFAGWSTNPNADVAMAKNGDSAYINTLFEEEAVDGNILYAVWIPQTYRIQVTDGSDVLYYKENGIYQEARFRTLGGVYNELDKLYKKVGDEYIAFDPTSADNNAHIEMTVSEYEMEDGDNETLQPSLLDVTKSYHLTLTTAEGTSTCTIKHGDQISGQMLNLGRTDMTLTNITLDGEQKGGEEGGIVKMTSDKSKLTLDNGATLENGVATGSGLIPNPKGGAVYMLDGTLVMKDGSKIKDCSAKEGGAVYMAAGLLAEFTMEGGEITGCTATDKGGALAVNGTATVSGGTITGNSSTNGGAVNFGTSGVLNLSGDPVIYDNTDSSGNQKNVDTSGVGIQTVNNKINVNGTLKKDAHIGVYAPSGHDAEGEQFGSYTGSAQSTFGRFSNDKNPALFGTGDGSGALVWKSAVCKITDGDKVIPFPTLSDAIEYARENMDGKATVEMIVPTYDMPADDALKIKEGDEITITTASTTDKEYPYRGTEGQPAVIKRNFDGDSLFTVSGGSLVLDSVAVDGDKKSDSNPKGHTGGDGGLVSVTGGTFTIGDGTVLENSSGTNGGLVNVSGGTVTIEDGAELKNSSAENGGALYISGGDVVMDGGSISVNSATNGGGVYVAAGADFTMNGGTIGGAGDNDGNTAENGSAIYVNSEKGKTGGEVNITGGTITGNNATSGGAVDVGTYKDDQGKDTTTAKVNLSGDPEITGNTTSTGTGGNTEERNIVLPTDGNDVINTSGLTGGTVGVYVPEELSDDHGLPMMPFGTFNDVDENGHTIPVENLGLNHIVNDATGMTGAARTNADNPDEKSIVWMKIVPLTVKKIVNEETPSDMVFNFVAFCPEDNDPNNTYTYLWNDGTNIVTFTENQPFNTVGQVDGQPFKLADKDIQTAPAGAEKSHDIYLPAGMLVGLTETVDDAGAIDLYTTSLATSDADKPVGLSADPAPVVEGHTAKFTIDPSVDAASVTVVNDKTTLTISNVLDDFMANAIPTFTYTITILDAAGNPLTDANVGECELREADQAIMLTMTTNDQGVVTVTHPTDHTVHTTIPLQADRDLVLSIPRGARVLVSQDETYYFKTDVDILDDDGNVVNAANTLVEMPVNGRYNTSVSIQTEAADKNNHATENTNRVFQTGNMDQSATLSFTNSLFGKEIRIRVMGDDADGAEGLEGGQFTISSPAQNIQLEGMTVSGTSDPKGLVVSPNMTDGRLFILPNGAKYTVHETEAPQYYDTIGDIVMSSGDANGNISIASIGGKAVTRITDDGIIMVEGDTAGSEVESGAKLILEDGMWTLTLTNKRKLATVRVVKILQDQSINPPKGYNYEISGNGLTLSPNVFTMYGVENSTQYSNTQEFVNVPWGKAITVTEQNPDPDDEEIRNVVVVEIDAESSNTISNIWTTEGSGKKLTTGALEVTGNTMTIYFRQVNLQNNVKLTVQKKLDVGKSVSSLTDEEIAELKKLSFTFSVNDNGKGTYIVSANKDASNNDKKYVLSVNDHWNDGTMSSNGSIITWNIPKAWGVGFSNEGQYEFTVSEDVPTAPAKFNSDTANSYTLGYNVVKEGDETETLRITELYRDSTYVPTPTPALPAQDKIQGKDLFYFESAKDTDHTVLASFEESGDTLHIKMHRDSYSAVTTNFAFDFTRNFEISGTMTIPSEDSYAFAFQTEPHIHVHNVESAYSIDNKVVNNPYLRYGTEAAGASTTHTPLASNASSMGEGFLFLIANEPHAGIASYRMYRDASGRHYRQKYEATSGLNSGETYKYSKSYELYSNHELAGGGDYSFIYEYNPSTKLGKLTITIPHAPASNNKKVIVYDNFDPTAMFGAGHESKVYLAVGATVDHITSLQWDELAAGMTIGNATQMDRITNANTTFLADRDHNGIFETVVNTTDSFAVPGEIILVRHEISPKAGGNTYLTHENALITQLLNTSTNMKVKALTDNPPYSYKEGDRNTYELATKFKEAAFNSYTLSDGMSIAIFPGNQKTIFEYQIMAPTENGQTVIESAIFGEPPFAKKGSEFGIATGTYGFRTEGAPVTHTNTFNNNTRFYTLTYNMADASSDANSTKREYSLVMNSDEKVKSPEQVIIGYDRPGYEFQNWKCGDKYYEPGNDLPLMTSNLTLTAQWKRKVKVEKTWVENGGVTHPTNLKVKFTGEGVNETKELPTGTTTWTFGDIPIGVNHAEELSVPNYINTSIEQNWVNTVDGYFKITITNTRAVCMIVDKNGNEHLFTSLTDAMTFVGDSNNNSLLTAPKTATIQMLTDYTMDKDDALNIPSGYDITLTTADKFDPTSGKSGYVGSDTSANPQATIARGDDNDKSLITSSGSLTMTDIALDGKNKKTSDNGSLINISGGSLNLEEGTTLKNAQTSGNGGAIYISTTNAVDLTGVTFENCSADGNGGAVYTDPAKTPTKLTVTDSTFTNCDAKNGGGIYTNSATEVKGTTFTECDATSGNGGAVYGNGTVTVGADSTGNPTIIKDCSATAGTNGAGNPNANEGKGAAIYVPDGKELTLNGGNSTSANGVQITGNKATNNPDGGAINVGSTTDSQGNVTSHGTVNVGGNVTIKDNTGTGGQEKNVVLDCDSNDVIKTTSGGLGDNASVGVYVTDSQVDKHGQYQQPFATPNGTNSDNGLNKFTNDRYPGLFGEKGTDANGNETVNWTSYACKLTDENGNLLYKADGTPAVFKTVEEALAATKTELYTTKDGNKSGVDNRYSYNAAGGNQPIQLQMLSDYTVPADSNGNMQGLNIDANREVVIKTASKTPTANDPFVYSPPANNPSKSSATITRGGNGDSLITVGSPSTAGAPTLTLEGVTLDGGSNNSTPLSANTNGGLINMTEGTLNINSGTTLQNSDTTGNGGAVYAASGTTVNLTDGTISGNSATDGGAIYSASGSTVNLSGGTISDNSSTGDGGAVYAGGNSTVNLTGSTISGNSSDGEGGAIYAGSGTTVNMTGGTVSGNSSDSDGGAVYAASGTTVNLTGGTISGNSSDGNGGAVYAASGSTVELSGGTISGNSSDGDGAGIYLGYNSATNSGATLKLSGNPDFGSGNFKNETLTGKTNGGEAYTRPRQDVFLAGYLGKVGGSGANKDEPKMATSIVVTGPITSDKPIWVSAEKPNGEEEDNHYEQLKQFAVLDDSLLKTNADGEQIIDQSKLSADDLKKIYSAFRNGVDDDTANNTTGEPLTGAEGPNGESPKYIFWSGVSGSRRVILRKVEDGTNHAIKGAKFTIYTKSFSVAKDADKNPLENLETSSTGIIWLGTMNYGVYYLHEHTVPDGYNGAGTHEAGTDTGRWFYLVVGEGETVKSIEGYSSKAAVRNAYNEWKANNG